jgi:Family of unknown function (DUF6353)
MMLTGLIQQVNKAKFLLENHSTTILTGIGVGGTVATAVLTGRASFKAARIIEQEKLLFQDEVEAARLIDAELSRTTKVKLVWKQYLPPVASGVVTVTAIVVANKISSKKIAALAVAGGISERALQEYKEKVVERLGAKQNEKLRDEIAQDRVSNAPINSKEVILAGTGEVLCYDMLSGRYFQSTVEEIKRAENKVNFEIVQFMRASLSEFYDEIGLPPTPFTDSVGWNANNPIELALSTVMSPDGRPCIAVDFTRHPTHDYDRTDY